MSTRFIGNLGLLLAGAIVVVVSQAFSPFATGWVMFGVALGILALLGVAQLVPGRGLIQRLLDSGTGLLALAAAVTSVVYTASTVMWLSFGEAIGFVALAAIGLIAHELKTERIVHTLEAVPAETEEGRRAEEYHRTVA